MVNYTWFSYGDNPTPGFQTNYTREWNFVNTSYGVVGDYFTYNATENKTSYYKIGSYPQQRGFYHVYTFICAKDSIPCAVLSDYE